MKKKPLIAACSRDGDEETKIWKQVVASYMEKVTANQLVNENRGQSVTGVQQILTFRAR